MGPGEEPEYAHLLRWRPFTIASALSVATVAFLFPLLLLLGFIIAMVGLAFAAATRTERQASRAAVTASTGFGFLVGPVLYLALALVISVA